MRGKRKKQSEKPVLLDQWIEVRLVDDKFVSTFYPSNEELEKERLDMDPEPTMVYRRLNFVDGVPPIYKWCLPSAETKVRGGFFIHRMGAEEWPKIMRRERELGNRFVVQADRPLGRPEAFGICPCEECRLEREGEVGGGELGL